MHFQYLNARIEMIPDWESDLGYSDGVGPKQQCVFVFTAQELDVVRLFLDVGMLRGEEVQAEL